MVTEVNNSTLVPVKQKPVTRTEKEVPEPRKPERPPETKVDIRV
tara:strand:- start:575 stop:706 length:132 start_codon:yes stop_codon:yes gene_type:complete